ncbi:MAG TPA: OmpW family outer membrane protein [Frateuria sp.]|uniref:OmpW/AlkL family protein n=1 Tax=Frateuria sp. TaxID=2211372 RepID=UPI002D7F8E01|nr:OmpW family outer membrane protein [Frateuria sp.]HET6803935.1 OmpW family outer membrane protein [Frateuria sp.]
METRALRILYGCLLALPAVVSAAEAQRWFIRGGAAYADFHASAQAAIAGQQIPGGSATVRHNIGVAFEGGYYIAPNWSVALTLGVPPTAKIYGEGSLASAGKLGEATYGPSVLALQYHFPTGSRWQPYIGAGLNYTVILDTNDAAIRNLGVRNGSGSALQLGVEYRLNDRYALFVDAKKIWVAVRATGWAQGPGGLVPATARVTLNPVIYNVGVSFHF